MELTQPAENVVHGSPGALLDDRSDPAGNQARAVARPAFGFGPYDRFHLALRWISISNSGIRAEIAMAVRMRGCQLPSPLKDSYCTWRLVAPQ